jgi:type II secretory pathway component GspD/PulD (secretin)
MRSAQYWGRFLLLAGMVLSLPAVLSCQGPKKPDAKGAEKAVERGDKAREQGNLQAALASYDEAARLAPGVMAVAEHGAVLRSQIVRTHVDTAENDAVQGNLTKAIQELRAALQIDPRNAVVAERLREMQSMKEDEELPAAEKEQPALAGVPKLRPRSGKKDFDIRGDTKSAYETVAKAFGVAVAFDPDLPSRNVKLRVEGVDFYTALELLEGETATFWRPLNSSLLFVAPDTAQKRREYAIQAEETFPLPEALAPEDMTETLRVLREISGAIHVELDTKTRSITVRDTVDKVMLAGELIRQIVRGRGELMLDIQLLEVNTNVARKLGVTPPSQTQAIALSTSEVQQLEQATTLANLLTILQQIFTARGITTSATSVVPVGGGKSTYLLGLPSATANFSEALSLVRSGREILLRAEDKKPATFFVGTRFPVTLSLLSASLGGTVLGGALTGTTFPRTDFTVGAVPVAITAADFDNDGARDLATANSQDNSITVLLNQGNGNFAQATGSPIALGANEQGPEAIASGVFRLTDATHLRQPADLVIANAGSNTVSVLLGNGDGTFVEAAGSPFAVGTQPRAVVVADFNGDGKLDFAVANSGDNSISVFEGNGDGTFAQFPNSPFKLAASEQGPVAMVTGNFAHQGTPDLAVVNQATNDVAILTASGDSTFNGTFTEVAGSPITVGQLPVAIAGGDLNADGIPDLAVVNQTDNTVTVLLNNGDGTFVPAAGSPLPTSTTPSGITIADFTQDGLGDIAVTNAGVSTLGVYIGLGSGLFSSRIELSTPAGPDAVTSEDLNGDGLPDIALTSHSSGANQVSVFLDPQSFASGSVAQVPFPGSEYIDLGVKVKATPTMNSDDEVTLQLEFEIRSLAGTSVNGIPVLTNRTLSQTVRLKEDETSLIGGLLDEEETRSIAGLPGLANLPAGAGQLFGTRDNSKQDTELLILVTPRRLRLPEREARAIFAGRGRDVLSEGAPGFVPAVPSEGPPPQPQQPQQEQPQPQQQPPQPPPQPPPQ